MRLPPSPLLICALLAPSTVSAQGSTTPAAPAMDWSIEAQIGSAILSPSLDLALEGSHRWERFGVLVKADWNRWINTQKDPLFTNGALNLGIGAEYWYLDGRARSAVVVGPSVLLFRTVLDDVGTTGLFLDLYPTTLCWSLSGPLHLRLDPLSFHVVAPVIDVIPLIFLEYRTSVALEWRL